MFAGRKLLIADDSPYYRTVLGLTFRDEGMEVISAENGRDALEIIEQSPPDVVLASVLMPSISGFELCRRIKQGARSGHIPVMLLTGLHEPFDEAEAQRAGADDVVTKPFKSIRELVGRVGSLLGGKTADGQGSGGLGHSTLGLGGPEPSERELMPARDVATEPPAIDERIETVAEETRMEAPDEHNMTDVKVFVEAPLMAEHESLESAAEPAGSTCVADVALQTADTQQLHRIDDEPARAGAVDYAQADTMELPVVRELKPPAEESASTIDDRPQKNETANGITEMSEQINTPIAASPTPAVFTEGLLDLGDFDSPAPVTAGEDLVLDLDYEEPGSISVVPEVSPEAVFEAAPEFEPPPVAAVAVEPEVLSEPATAEGPQSAAEREENSFDSQPAAAMPAAVPHDQPTIDPVDLTPAVIDAIARRVVELMSDQVVREIAWEVVPELSELLIKQKMDEQK